MKQATSAEIEARFQDNEGMENAMREGVIRALRIHKALGNPIAVWRDNQVVWIPAEEIQVPPLPADGREPSSPATQSEKLPA